MKLGYVVIHCECKDKKKPEIVVHSGGHGHECTHCDRIYDLEIDEHDKAGIVLSVFQSNYSKTE